MPPPYDLAAERQKVRNEAAALMEEADRLHAEGLYVDQHEEYMRFPKSGKQLSDEAEALKKKARKLLAKADHMYPGKDGKGLSNRTLAILAVIGITIIAVILKWGSV